MELRTLPPDAQDKFWKWKRPEEYLGIAKFKKSDLNFLPREDMFLNWGGHVDGSNRNNIITNYYLEDLGRKIELADNGIPVDNAEYVRVETYSKMVWLFKEYLERGFVNPVGVHYRKDKNGHFKWEIHPGGTRQVALEYLHPADEPIYGMTFNTYGAECDFVKIFNSIEEVYDFYAEKGTNMHFGLVAEMGTLIPHICTDTDLMQNSVVKTHYDISEVAQNYRFQIHPMIQKFLGSEITGNITSKKSIVVDLNVDQFNRMKEKKQKQIAVKAMALLPTQTNWDDGILRITRNE